MRDDTAKAPRRKHADAQHGHLGSEATSEWRVDLVEGGQGTLTEGEVRLRALVMASTDVVYRMSPDWREMRTLEGRSFLADTPAPFAGWLARYIPPEDQALVLSVIGEAVRTRSTFEFEHRVIRADGTPGWTHSRAVPFLDAHGEIIEWLGTATDITARHEVSDALEASEARAKLALDVAQLGTWSWDPSTNTGTLDTRGAEIVGLVPGELADVWAAQVAAIHPDDLAKTLAAVEAGIVGGEPFSLDYRVLGADGTVRHVASRARAERDAAGQLVRLVGTNRDVTAERQALAERERLLAEATAARAAAEMANRVKSEFLAVISHELRTPLNAIGGYAQLLEMGIRGAVTPEQSADLRRIQASQRHLLSLIDNVLHYAKIERGAIQYDVTVARAQDALAGAEALVFPQAQAKGVVLSVGACAPDLEVRADVEKLRQILVNLLSNAIKFTDRGGRVELTCVDGGDEVHITVRDTGIGIAAEQHGRIFEPFVQVRADSGRAPEGTGLGLAISRELARGMSGDLAVESAAGAGSTFTLTLPRA